MMRRTEIRDGRLRLVPLGELTTKERNALDRQQADAELLRELNRLRTPAPADVLLGPQPPERSR